MNEKEAYFIEDIKLRKVERKEFYSYVVEPPRQCWHPWKKDEKIDIIDNIEVIELPIRDIMLEDKLISFYYDTVIDKFLGSPFTIIKNQQIQIEVLNKRLIQSYNPYKEEMKNFKIEIKNLNNELKIQKVNADEKYLKLMEKYQKLLYKSFWQKLKDLLLGSAKC